MVIESNQPRGITKMINSILFQNTANQNRNLFENMFGRMLERKNRRIIRQSLLKMDDHVLRDIGLSRHAVLANEF